jgi:hypothetical protein
MPRFALVTSLSLVVTAVACHDGGAPPADPTTVATTAPVTTVIVDAGVAPTPAPLPPVEAAAPTPPATPTPAPVAPGGDAGTDFFACSTDTDCVAVPVAVCCPTGHRAAVNAQSVDAYKATAKCEGRHRLCPMYRVLDKRVPICAIGSHKCEMVAGEKIACMGSGPDVHACPGGTPCDSTGHCGVPAVLATPP